MRNKIEALEHALYVLKNNLVQYNFYDTCKCNCGILAQSVLETGVNDAFKEMVYDMPGIWGTTAKCNITGDSLSRIFVILNECGFTPKDMWELEELSNKNILKEAGVRRLSVSSKEALIAYLEAWVRILEREQPPVTESPSPVMTFVKQSEMAEKQELILVN